MSTDKWLDKVIKIFIVSLLKHSFYGEEILSLHIKN